MPDITVHFTTNRSEQLDQSPPFGDKLNANTPLFLRYGTAAVTPPGGRRSDFKVRTVSVAPDVTPGVNAALGAEPVRGSADVYDGLRQRLGDNKADLLLFLHGFNCGFDMALVRAAELKQNWSSSATPLEVAVFSWPADTSLVPAMGYVSDRDDARSSAKAVARALLNLVAFFERLKQERLALLRAGKPLPPICEAKLHLVAHSMGNYALRNAFQAVLSELGGKVPRLFQNIFLMAADEDNDAFEHEDKLMHLPDFAHAVHVYYALNDNALTISDVTKLNPDRLGTAGPRTLSGLPQKVTLVDCTRVSATSALEVGHQYYRQRPEVLDDIRAVLAGKAPADVPNREFLDDKRAFRIKPKPRR
jgi:esterase/lipase superfamily enzyme